MEAKIQEYWNKRALEATGTESTSTDDVYMRKLENATILDAIKKCCAKFSKPKVLDLGCGDGGMLLFLAKEIPQISGVGVDFSQEMINIAEQKISSQGIKDRLSFHCDEFANLEKYMDGVNIIISCRALINLPDTNSQFDVIKKIHNSLPNNGCYVGVENFIGTLNEFNKARNVMGLPDIKVRWHNHYFEISEFMQQMNSMFRDIQFNNFASSYYFATRVVYSSLCSVEGKQPDYMHPVHQHAINLPPFGDFCPTKMFIAEK